MKTIEKSIDVRVPVSTAYRQWTQFDSFPAFMSGVARVTRVSPTMTHWETSIGGRHQEFDAEITEQYPDERIAWRTVDGSPHGGAVTFHRIDDTTTRVYVQMEYEPEGLTEQAASALGMVDRRVRGDLDHFKNFIEQRGGATDAWRREVPRPLRPGAVRKPRADRGGTSSRSVPPQSPSE